MPERTPIPLSTIPFRRDPDFVDRRSLLDLIREKLSLPASRIALAGMSGVGKSQLAMEYGYRFCEQFPASWVLWVHGSDPTRLEQGFRDVADMLKVPGRKDPGVDIFRLIWQWLFECQERWLLILDNVDDADHLLETQASSSSSVHSRDLWSYIPETPNSAVIVTTRSRIEARKLRLGDNQIIEVPQMNSEEALELLRTKLPQQKDVQSLVSLAEELECMPLAMIQAAAYIAMSRGQCSPEVYLEEFRRSKKSRARLLERDVADPRRDMKAPKSSMITWQITFDYLLHTRPSAANLLSIMSFFDRQAISESIVKYSPLFCFYRNGWVTEIEEDSACSELSESGSDSSELSDEESTSSEFSSGDIRAAVVDDLITLMDYSFVRELTNKSLGMHALVQLAMRQWLKKHKKLTIWRNRSISFLYQYFPTIVRGELVPLESKAWDRCQILLPHIKATLEDPPGRDDSSDWHNMLGRASSFLCQEGNGIEAERLLAPIIAAWEESGDEKDQTALETAGLRLQAYRVQGRWVDARRLGSGLLQLNKEVFGECHRKTMAVMNELATVYRNLGHWKEAERLYRQAIETSGRTKGEDCRDVVTMKSNLILVVLHQDRYEEAEKIGREAVRASEERFGINALETQEVKVNLGVALSSQGKWDEAVKLEEEAVKAMEETYGFNHPSTLDVSANLSVAWAHASSPRWKEAEKLTIRVMEARETIYGSKHSKFMQSLSDLGRILLLQNRDDEAEEPWARAVKLGKELLGPQHPQTIKYMSNLTKVYVWQERWGEAEELGTQMVEMSVKSLGEDHLDTIHNTITLASILRNRERWIEAEEQCLRALQGGLKVPSRQYIVDHSKDLLADMYETYCSRRQWNDMARLRFRVQETVERL